MTDTPNPMLAAALDYAARGWKIFPLKPASKVPATRNGHKDATDDTKRITAHWTAHPDHGVGLNLAASGLVAVDVDPRAGGKETLDNVEFAHGELDRTATQLTGRGDGGEHLIFKALPGDSYPGGLGPGVDVKHNGYVVVAPSIHPDTGGVYRWAQPLPDDLPTRPDWLPKPQRSAAATQTRLPGGDVGADSAGGSSHDADSADPLSERQWADTLEALEYVKGDEREVWRDVGFALRSTQRDEAFGVWNEWSSRFRGYAGLADQERFWEAASATGGLDYRYILARAKEAGWVGARPPAGHHFGVYEEGIVPDPDAPQAVAVTPADLGITPPAPPEPMAGGFRWSDYEGQSIPEREWVAEERVGLGHITTLYGRGGVGKSLISQQLATSVVTAQPFVGTPTRQGRVLGIFCEDDRDELRRRQAGINRGLGTSLHDIDAFEAYARVGSNNVLVSTDSRTNIVQGTRFLTDLERLLDAAATAGDPYVLVILDNLAQMFAIDENNRSQVTQAMAKIAALAEVYNPGMLLLGHPGKATESAYSGSTAWDASARSRLWFGRPVDPETGKELMANKDERVLRQVKSNYAQTDDLPLVWRGGCYVRLDQGPEAAARAQAVTLRMREAFDTIAAAMRDLAAMGVTQPTDEPTSRTRYLPKLMEAHNMLGTFGIKEIGKALHRARETGIVVRRTGKNDARKETSWIELPIQGFSAPLQMVTEKSQQNQACATAQLPF